MVLAAENTGMYLAMTGYVIGFIATPLLVWKKNLSPVMYLAGIFGLLGLIAAALSSPRCKTCRQSLSREQFKRRVCPTCRKSPSPSAKAD